MTLSEKLRDLRQDAGISQEEVAGRLFVSRQSISKWENGQAEPGVENLKALADLYGVTLDELTGREASAPAPEEWERNQAEDEEEETKRISNYRYLVIGRSVVVALGNLHSWSAYSKINFPFDLIFMLVGLGIRAAWVYWVTAVLVCINLVTQVIFALTGDPESLLALAVHVVILILLTRKEIRGYFHLS